MTSVFPVSNAFQKSTRCRSEDYERLYQESLIDPETFWGEQAKRISWMKPFSEVKNVSFEGDVRIRWYEGGVLNVTESCLDRHLEHHGDRVAFYWEPDDPNGERRSLTYRDLHREVCKLVNVLKSEGVKKGDRVTIYMPMIPEAIVSVLACARMGAIHSVIFGGFAPDSIADRIVDCKSGVVITADFGKRSGKRIPLKANVDEALKKCPSVTRVIVYKHTGDEINWDPKRDRWWHSLMSAASEIAPPEPMDAEDPLFILYTSGSTNKPKAVLHTTAGYLVYASLTHELVFDHQPADIYWCTADIGWITGHTYSVYGPLANAATSVIFEGVPQFPNPSRFWEIVDRYQVSIFYTAPTALRALMREGNHWVKKASRKTLRVLGSVGEPINPEAWLWYHEVIGEGRCPIVDTWWQTETGGILISPLPGATSLKPGSATKPLFGIKPAVVDEKGMILEGECEGYLVLLDSWPGQMRTVFQNHDRFKQTYFSLYPGMYFTGDGCRRDADGYYWITGRVDDTLNVSGHRLGSAELESALVSHHAVAEAAVVGCSHDIKGQGIYAFVTLKAGVDSSESLKSELKAHVKKEIGGIATPDFIQFASGLPKTRSGKIMRRILRKIVERQTDELGDTSTLADPNVIQDLIKNALSMESNGLRP